MVEPRSPSRGSGSSRKAEGSTGMRTRGKDRRYVEEEVDTPRKKAPKVESRKRKRSRGLDPTLVMFIVALVIFGAMSMFLYSGLDGDFRLRSVLKQVHGLHRKFAKLTRSALRGVVQVRSSMSGSEGQTDASPPPKLHAPYLLPKPAVLRFGGLQIPSEVDLSTLATLPEVPPARRRLDPSYLHKPSPELKIELPKPKPPKPPKPGAVPDPDLAQDTSWVLDAAPHPAPQAAPKKVGLHHAVPYVPEGDMLRGSVRTPDTQGAPADALGASGEEREAYGAGTQGGAEDGVREKEANLRPSQKKRLKDAKFRLGEDKIHELLNQEVDVAASQLLLEMRGSIPCGGRPVMQFNDMDEVVAIEGINPVLPATNDLAQKAGNGASLGKCAVIGNSGELLEHNRQEEIDAHDSVIRFNAAPTKGYEAHVGTKTTVRVQNVDHLGFREKQDTALIFSARTDKDVKKFIQHRMKYMNRLQYMFNPNFWCHVWDWVAHRKLKPSSGMAGVVFALKTCTPPVTIYGFSHNSTKFHYFDTLPAKVTTQEVYWFHPLVEENAILHELQEMGLTNIVGGT